MTVSAHPLVPRRAPSASVAGLLAVRDAEGLKPTAAPDPATADAYLRLTSHLLMQAERQQLKSVGVVSAFKGEGKTTAAMNLALCLGRTRGRRGRVLLVDADAQQRSLTALLGGDTDAPGAEGQPLRHPMLLATAFEGVDLMTAPNADGGLAIYAPGVWRTTIQELSQRYEHVVLDCPSLLDNPLGQMLRDCVDGLVMVVKAGRATRKDVERALTGASRRVLGVVLNGADGRPLADPTEWR